MLDRKIKQEQNIKKKHENEGKADGYRNFRLKNPN